MTDDHALQIMAQLSAIQALATEANTKITALDDRLFNGSGVIATIEKDITEIKDDRKDDEKWERIHNVLHYSIGPALVGIHATLRRLGVNI